MKGEAAVIRYHNDCHKWLLFSNATHKESLLIQNDNDQTKFS